MRVIRSMCVIYLTVTLKPGPVRNITVILGEPDEPVTVKFRCPFYKQEFMYEYDISSDCDGKLCNHRVSIHLFIIVATECCHYL